MQPTTSSFASTQSSRFTDEGSQSTTPLECSCGAVFKRRNLGSPLSRYRLYKDCGDSDGHFSGAAGISVGSVLAICPSCGAENCFEPNGHQFDY
jgi:hypothetical protein